MPGHLRTGRQFGGAGAHAHHDLVHVETRLPQHFGERLRIRAIGWLRHRRDFARTGVEADETAAIGIGQRQARRRCRFLGEGAWVSQIEQHDLGAILQASERTRQIGKTNGGQRQIDFARDARAGWNEIVLTVALYAIAREINGRDGTRTGGLHLLDEFSISGAECIDIEIARARHIETGGLQSIGDESRVIGGGRQRGIAIIIIADDETESRFGRLAGWLLRDTSCLKGGGEQCRDDQG